VCAEESDNRVVPVAVKLFGGFILRGRMLPGMLLAVHLPFVAFPLLRTDVRSLHFWIAPVCLGFLLLLLLRRRSVDGIRWGKPESLLLLIDAACLALAFFRQDPVWAGLACVFATAAFAASYVDRIGNRHLGGLALLIWAAIGIPGNIAGPLQRQATIAVTQLASNLAWRIEISNYREGQTLHSISSSVDIEQLLWHPAAWTCVFLMTVFWGVLLRRSVMQTLGLLLSMIPVFLLATSLQAVWLLQPRTGSPLGSTLATSLCLLPIYLGMLASTDFFVRFVTAPVPVVARQGEAASWDNPFIHYWNTLVAGFAMVPLQKTTTAVFRLPLPAAALCLLLLPVPPVLLFALAAGVFRQLS
jgi:hypothetical protein